MPSHHHSAINELVEQARYQTQEKLLQQKKTKGSLYIGIPKEITFQEKRVPLCPLSAELLINNGHRIIMEAGVGSLANFEDLEYSEVGVELTIDKSKVFDADIILKIDPPTTEELALMKPHQILISALQLANLKPDYLQIMMRKKITAIAFEFIRDESGMLPIIRSMSEIAGRTSVFIAAEYLSNTQFGKGELMGGIPGLQPTKVVVIGAGAVGEYAVRAAMGLGAQVQVFDNSLYKLRRLETNIGSRIYSSTIIPKILASALAKCDVAIGAMRAQGNHSPCVVSEEMVTKMRPKSLIIDVSIDQGGCFETSRITNHEKPTFVLHDVIHYCVPNIASKVARTASYALSNIFTSILLDLGEEASFKDFLWRTKGMRDGVYLYKGSLTNAKLGNRFNMKSQNIDFMLV